MSEKVLLTNKRARFDYEVLETLEAGLVLTGAEVKSLRRGAGSLTGSFVQILANGRPVLLGVQINAYPFADNRDYDPKRTRFLLLKKSQIATLQGALSQKGLSLVPLSILTRGPFLKVQIALARGKKKYDKRAAIKKRDIEREIRKI
jgi:SsrA-binding protein